MFELLLIFCFVWLLIKAVGLAVRVAWGTAKVLASVLFVLAIPMLVLCIVFAGGMLLLFPLALVGAAFGLLKLCC